MRWHWKQLQIVLPLSYEELDVEAAINARHHTDIVNEETVVAGPVEEADHVQAVSADTGVWCKWVIETGDWVAKWGYAKGSDEQNHAAVIKRLLRLAR
jgi:hypothetical protein